MQHFLRFSIRPLTEQFAYKLTRGQSSRGLDNSRTSQLADSEFLKIMELLYLMPIGLYINPNPDLNSNPIEYWQRINSVICPK